MNTVSKSNDLSSLFTSSSHMVLTVCIKIHSQPHVHGVFPHLWAIINCKVILLGALERQKLWNKECMTNMTAYKELKKWSRIPFPLINKLNICFTKPLAEASRSLIGVAFDLVLCSMDKVVTFVLEWNPCSSICRTVWGGHRTGQRLQAVSPSHTTLQQLPRCSSFLLITAGFFSIVKCFPPLSPNNNNWKDYVESTLNLSRQTCSTTGCTAHLN